MKVLVTGGLGFLGKYVSRALINEGHQVHLLVRQASNGDLSQATPVFFDGLDPRPAVLASGPYGAIVNLATSYGRDRDHFKVAQSNVIMPLLLREVASRVQCGHWVEAGSFYTEAPPTGPLASYTQSKQLLQAWLERHAESEAIPTTVAHLYHLYGPGDRADKFIPTIIQQCMRGTPIDLTHGNQVRDFVFVEDAAAIIADLTVGPTPSGWFRKAPIGTGVGTSIRSLVRIINDACGGKSLLNFGAITSGAGEIAHAVAPTPLIHEVMRRQMMSVEFGVQKTIDAHV